MTEVALIGWAFAIAVAGLLVSEWRHSEYGIRITKPLASTLFIVIAVFCGAHDSTFGQWILLGLGLSWFGDVFLLGKRDAAFVAGLSAFLLAHIAYIVAFVTQALTPASMIATGIVMSIVGVVVLRWLWPGLPRTMKLPVTAYVIVIGVMVISAGGTTQAWGPLLLMAAAVFAASDIFVARERFVHTTVVNRLIGLPLYYGAQLALALSVTVIPA